MSNCEEFKKYEEAKERVNKRTDIIESLNLIIKEYLEDDDVTFSSSAYALNELKLEIERETSEDVEIVDKYEQEEHDDEVRCMNEHEF